MLAIVPMSGGSPFAIALNGTDAGALDFVAANATLTVTVEPSDVLKGDVSLDGNVDFGDIAPFIAVLQSNGFQAEADCNYSGMVDFGDISAFIDILQNQ